MSLSLNRGQVATGKDRATGRIQLAAASTWATTVASGYFYKQSSGKATMLAGTESTVSGWVDIGNRISDGNIVDGVLTVPTDTTGYEHATYTTGATFYLPVKSGQTLALTDGDKPITVSVSSGVQSADLDNTGTKSLFLVCSPTPEEIAANIVRVMINPAKLGTGA